MLKKITARHLTAAVLALVALGFTAWLAVRSAGDVQPTRREAAALAGFSGLFQVAAAYVMAGAGRADPSLARSAVRRLTRVAIRADAAERRAQEAYETGDPDGLRREVGILGVELNFLQESTLDAIEDWREFHGAALDELKRTSE